MTVERHRQRDNADCDRSHTDASEKIFDQLTLTVRPKLTKDNIEPAELSARRLVSREQLDELTRLTLEGNQSAKTSLTRLSNIDSPITVPDKSWNDPVYGTVRLLSASTQYHDRIEAAAVGSFAKHNDKDLLKTIGEIAANDPQMLQQMKNSIQSNLKSDSEERRAGGLKLLLSIPGQWEGEELKLALKNLRRDDLDLFREAFPHAPNHLKKCAFESIEDERSQTILQATLTQRENFGRPKQKENPFTLSLLDIEANNSSPWPFDRTTDDRQIQAYENQLKKLWPEQGYFNGQNQASDLRYVEAAMGYSINLQSAVKAEQIIANWGVSGETKEQQGRIQDVISQYGATLTKVDTRLALYNALSPETRKQLTGSKDGAEIDARQIFGKMANGTMEADNQFSFLLVSAPGQSLEEKLAAKARAQNLELNAATALLDRQISTHKGEINGLTNHARDGVGFLNRLDQVGSKLAQGALYLSPLALTPLSIVDGNSLLAGPDGVDRWSGEQAAKVQTFVQGHKKLQETVTRVQEQTSAKLQLDLASDAFQFTKLKDSGDKEMSDLMALGMVDKYGLQILRDKAPVVFRELTEENGALSRLKAEGLTQAKTIPDFQTGITHGFKQALRSFANFVPNNQQGTLDMGALRKNALQAVDAEPTLAMVSDVANKIGSELPDLTKMYEAAITGDKFEAYIKTVREKAGRIEEALNGIDVPKLTEAVEQLHSAAALTRDGKTREDLTAREEAVKQMLALADPSSPQSIKLKKMFAEIQSRDFSPNDFGHWIKENGPTIAAAIAATALTAATMGTASPLAFALVSSANIYVATQATKESLFLINHGLGDTGLGKFNERSYLGGWTKESVDRFGKAMSNAGKDTAGDTFAALMKADRENAAKFLSDVVAPSALEYSTNVAMMMATVGVVNLSTQGLKALSKEGLRALIIAPEAAQLMANVERLGAQASGSEAVDGLTKSWLASGTKLTRTVGSNGVQELGFNLADKGLKDLRMENSYAGFLLSTAFALAESKISHRSRPHFSDHTNVYFEPALKPEILAKLRTDGHTVVERPNGRLEVTPFNAPHGVPPVVMHFDQVVSTPNSNVPRARMESPFRERELGRRAVHYADGAGGNLSDPNQKLRINAAHSAIGAADLPARPLREAMAKYIDRGPKGIEVVQKALMADPRTRKEYGIDEAILRGDSPDQLHTLLKELPPDWVLGFSPAVDRQTGLPRHAQTREWMDNACRVLQLDADESQAMNKAIKESRVKFTMLDRKTLERCESNQNLWSFEGGERNKTLRTAESGLTRADDYNPAIADAAVLMFRTRENRREQYYVVNGCRRIHFFGSETSNPNNCALPVILFDSPESFEQVTGHNPRSGMSRTSLFQFEVPSAAPTSRKRAG